MIGLLFTGGTISMRHDVSAGGAVPALTPMAILAADGGCSMGAIFADSRRPQQARIDVMLAVGAGLGVAGLRDMMES